MQENRILLEENDVLKNCQKDSGKPCDVEASVHGS